MPGRADTGISEKQDCITQSCELTYTLFTWWSKHEANLEHTSCMCILSTFTSCLLH